MNTSIKWQSAAPTQGVLHVTSDYYPVRDDGTRDLDESLILEAIREEIMAALVITWEWDMPAVDDAQVEVICPICNGAGTGTGCWEQGGFIAGLCSECHGYGKWQRNCDSTSPPPSSPPLLPTGAGAKEDTMNTQAKITMMVSRWQEEANQAARDAVQSFVAGDEVAAARFRAQESLYTLCADSLARLLIEPDESKEER